jgi:predicted Zn-dependent peptidase
METDLRSNILFDKKNGFFLHVIIRKIYLSVLGICIAGFIFSQEKDKNPELRTFVLENGLTVYLNEDHSTPSVFGAVIIKTGGKYDLPHATGTSHYLEHMLFKGTDVIGTINYEEEKKYLDSIAVKYDELAGIEDEDQRKEIQKQINELSLKAGEYAIPNELDKILDMIGSTRVNAFTSNEIVAYFNVFPKSQMDNWLYIYSQRFINPVFRLFQSELETVFEEKNMYADNMMSTFIEKFYAKFYKNHPYGTQTILGSIDHIKNPSLTAMQKMYDTYYVANNMALILTGNFNTGEAEPMIKKYFGKWKNGEVPEFPEYSEKPFNGVEVVKDRITPIKVGVMGFRTIPVNHEDEIIFEVCQSLLNNSASTGYFDKLSLNGKLLGAIGMNDIKNDHGAFIMIYIPKIIGQSLKKARKIAYEEILKLHTGNIEKDFFESVKLGLIKEYEQSLEKSENKAFLIANMFVSGKTWQDIIDYPEQIQKVTIEDVKRVSLKYLGENYLSYESRMGFPKKDKLEKPGFDPVIPKNNEARSEFMENLEKRPEPDTQPEFVNIEKDLIITDIHDMSKLYHVKNNINNIFNLKIMFHSGLLNDRRYDQLSNYLGLIGTENQTLDEFNEKLQELGASVSISSGDNYFTIYIDGFDNYFDKTLELILELLKNPKADDSKLKIIRQIDSFSRRYEKSDPDQLSSILFEYGLYDTESEYMARLSKKDIKKLRSDDLLTLLQETLNKPYSIHYSGTLSNQQVLDAVTEKMDFRTKGSDEKFPIVRDRKKYTENTILFLDNPKALQSKIYFYVEGNKNNTEERAVANAFNQYFGSGMSSLVFQEIREFRSLAYSSSASYRNGQTLEIPGYLIAFVGTQSDKTIEAVSIMDSLISHMPQKENRMPAIKSLIIQSINSGMPGFRNLSEYVEKWEIQGYDKDPRIIAHNVFMNIDFNDIVKFYENNVAGKPILITIVGNKKQINMEELTKFGKIIEVKTDQIMN